MHSHVVALPHVTVGRSLRLTKVTIPDRLVVGDDADAEARRFRRTANSVCRITQPMVDALGRWGYPGAGTGSDHVREKDGLWAVLLWRDIVAARGESVGDILKDHWRTYGRDYCTRHDYEAIDTAVGDRLMAALRTGLPALPGRSFAGLTVSEADDFAYRDPTDGSVSARQGVRVLFDSGARAVFRLSGTGTEGATLRVYLEAFEPDPARHGLDPQEALASVIAAANAIGGTHDRTGRTAPDVVT